MPVPLRRLAARLALRLLLALVAVAAISVTVLWSFYGFRYSAKPAAGPLTILGLLPWAQCAAGAWPPPSR